LRDDIFLDFSVSTKICETGMNNILVISAGILHPNIRSRLTLSGFLREVDGYQFHFSTSTNDLRLLKNNSFSSLILFLHQSRISPQAFKALHLFLMKGGGLLALHSTSTCFASHPDFWDMIGGRYISRESAKEIEVIPKVENDEIFEDMKPFNTVDSLPVHELQFGVKVHFETRHRNQLIPVVWSKEYYLGKVVYCCLGHKASVLNVPEVREIFVRGMKWIDPVNPL
jgi:type 1 glutamine amidotransferase